MFKGISQERIDEILAANFLDKTNFTVDQNALVVNTGGKLALIDTGMGFRKVYGPRTGHLLSNLRAVGIDPASIDVVALSHGHPDHVWGLVGEDGKPNFPNAQIHITQADLEYWTDEAKLSDSALGHYIGPIRDTLCRCATASSSSKTVRMLCRACKRCRRPGIRSATAAL